MANQESTTTYKINDLWTAAMQKIMATQDKFSGKIKEFKGSANNAFGSVQDKLEKFKVKNMEAISGIAGEIPGASSAMALMANPYVAAGAAVVGVGVAIKKATDYAQQWESKMAQVNVTANLGKAELKGLSDQLLEIGSRNVAPLEEVPEAFNRILSAGLDVNTSLQALEPTLRASKAGFTDMATTAAAGVGVMNASGENINRVYDVLFATMNVGNAEFKDIAAYLPKIVPAARNAGFALHETGGAWAYLTAQGMTAERATTLMENAFKSLSNPDRINAFNKMGVAIYDNNGKMLPMIKIIEQLSGKMKGLTDKQRIAKLATLGLDMEAASAFGSMTQNVDKLRESIDFTTNSAGQLNEAYKAAEQSGDSWAVVSNKFKVVWEKIGEKFLPLLAKAGNWVLGLIDDFKDLYNNSTIFRDSLSAIGVAFEWMWKMANSTVVRIWNVFKGIGSVIAWAFGKLDMGNVGFENMYRSARPVLTWIYQMFEKVAGIAFKVFTFDFKGAVKDIANFKLPDIKQIKDQQSKEYAEMAAKDNKKEQNTSLNPNAIKPNGLDLSGMDGAKDKKKGTTREGGVSGGGSKSVTINIQHLLSGVTINATTIKDGAQDVARILQEEILKMIADVSLAGSN